MSNTVRGRSGSGQPFVIPLPTTDADHCTWLESHALSPEDALIAREEDEEGDPSPMEASEALPIDRLSEAEQMCLTLYYQHGRTQDEIAEVMGISQAMAAYHLRRSFHRLRWLSGPASWFTPETLYESCLAAGMSKLYSTMLADWWRTTSQTQAGEAQGMRQGRARHHLVRAREILSGLAQSRGNPFITFDLGLSELETWGQNAISRPRTEAHPQQAPARVRHPLGPGPKSRPRGRSVGRTAIQILGRT